MPAAQPADQLLVVALQRATHAVGLRIETELRDLRVSQGEAHVLALLGHGEAHTVGELQRGLHHRPSTLTGILDRLEKRGWITRNLNDADRRSLLVLLTRQGRRAAERVLAALQRMEDEAVWAAGAGAVRGFRRVARELAEKGG